MSFVIKQNGFDNSLHQSTAWRELLLAPLFYVGRHDSYRCLGQVEEAESRRVCWPFDTAESTWCPEKWAAASLGTRFEEESNSKNETNEATQLAPEWWVAIKYFWPLQYLFSHEIASLSCAPSFRVRDLSTLNFGIRCSVDMWQRWMVRMVLHALGHINQIASGDLATRCENVSLCDRSCFKRFFQFNLMEFCLTFLTRSRQLFLAKGSRSRNNLANQPGFRCCQWSRSAGSICSVDGWLFWAAGQPFNPKTKNCGTLEASFLVAFEWWTYECSAGIRSLLWLSGCEIVMLVTKDIYY